MQTIIPLTVKNFDKWLESATVEENWKDDYNVLTDYDNIVGVRVGESNFTIHDAPKWFTQEQIEKVFEKVYEFLNPIEEVDDYDVRAEQGIYGYGY